MAKNILAWSEAAKQFYREIGKKPNGKAIRFYLGDDEKKATAKYWRKESRTLKLNACRPRIFRTSKSLARSTPRFCAS